MSTKKKVLVTTGIVGALIVIYTAAGFWGVPQGVNYALKNYADPLIGRKCTTEKVEFNPYTLHLNIKGLHIQKEGAPNTLLHINDLDTQVSWKSLFKLSPIVDHITIDGLNTEIIRTGLANFSFSDIIERIEKMIQENADKENPDEKKDDSPMMFSIGNVQILNSSIKLDDKFRNRKDEITDLTLAVPLISNFETEVENPVTPNLSFNLNGKKFAADASSLPFTISKKTGANFNFKDVPVENLVSFVPYKLNAKVLSGDLSANLNLAFAEQDEERQAVKHLRLKGNVTIDNLAIEDNLAKTPEQVASFGKISVDIGSVALFAQKLTIDKVTVENPNIKLTRNGEKINLAELAAHIIAGPLTPAEAQAQALKDEKTEAKAIETAPLNDQTVNQSENTAAIAEQLYEKTKEPLEPATASTPAPQAAPQSEAKPAETAAPAPEAKPSFPESPAPTKPAEEPKKTDKTAAFSFISAAYAADAAPAKLVPADKVAEKAGDDIVKAAEKGVKDVVKGAEDLKNEAVKVLKESEPKKLIPADKAVEQGAKDLKDEAVKVLKESEPKKLVPGDTAVKHGAEDVIKATEKGAKDIAKDAEEAGAKAEKILKEAEPKKLVPGDTAVKHGAEDLEKASKEAMKSAEKGLKEAAKNAEEINVPPSGEKTAKELEKASSEVMKAAEKDIKEAAKNAAEFTSPVAEQPGTVTVTSESAAVVTSTSKAEAEKIAAEGTEQALQKAEDTVQAVETGSAEAAPAGDNAWNWEVKAIEVKDGVVNFTDDTVGFKTDVEKINVSLNNLSSEQNTQADLQASFDVLKGQTNVGGKVGIAPLNVNLDIDENGIDIPSAQPYIKPFTAAVLKSGKFSDKLNLSVKEDNGLMVTAVKGDVTAEDIGVGLNGAEVVKVGAIKTTGIDLKLGHNVDAEIGKVAIVNPTADVTLLKDGTVNLAAFAAPGKPAAAEAKKPAEKPAEKAEPAKKDASKPKEQPGTVNWGVKEIAIQNGTVNFTDQNANFTQKISALNLDLTGLSSKSMNGAQLNTSLNVLGGHIAAKGSVNLQPVGTTMNLKTSGLNLTQLKPYFSPYTTAQLGSALLGTDGTVTFSLKDNVPEITYKGSTDLTQVKAADKSGAEFVSFKALDIGGINFKFDKDISATVGSVVLDAPHVTITKPKKGPMNIETLVAGPATPAPKAAPQKHAKAAKAAPAQSSGLPPITISKIQVKNGAVSFTDQAPNPDFKLRVTKLDTTIQNFTTVGAKPFNVHTTASVNGAPLNVSGTVSPFGKSLGMDLKAKFSNFSMPLVSPYAADVTGYPIKQGQLSLNGTYEIKNEHLKTSNGIVINKLEFGNQVPNAKSTLPVGLAVSLLQNRDGVIDIDLPVTGKIDDPEFSVGGIVVQVIVNLITKAVTAPFSLIGSIFGGSSDMNLENIQFESGSAMLDDTDKKALEVISKAMADRPGIKLKVIGLASPTEDDQGLREMLLMREIQKKVYSDAKGERKLNEEQVRNGINKLFRSFDGKKPETENLDERKAFLLKSIPITQNELISLANMRAQRVKAYLTTQLKVAPDRLFIQNPIDNDLGNLKPGVKLELE